MTTALEAALGYAGRGWRIFPCWGTAPRRKQPATLRGVLDATNDPAVIDFRGWWRRDAWLIGLATGAVSGVVVLDVDVKGSAWGFDTLDELGFAILPLTPMAHTPSGGLHLYFTPGVNRIRNTQGSVGRGIGPGLDWRGDGGYVILPSPGSGYSWDPHRNFDSLAPLPVPPRLLPREIEREVRQPVKPAIGMSPYALAALTDACGRIVAAPFGQQEATLSGEAFSIGTLAGARAIPAGVALGALKYAASQVASYDPRRPWRAGQLDRKVERSFANGFRKPRGK